MNGHVHVYTYLSIVEHLDEGRSTDKVLNGEKYAHRIVLLFHSALLELIPNEET